MLRPLRGGGFNPPGRCPGLACCGPFGARDRGYALAPCSTLWEDVAPKGPGQISPGQRPGNGLGIVGTVGNKIDAAVTCEESDSSRVQHQEPSTVDCQELSQCLVCVSGRHLQRMGESSDHDRRRRGSRPCAVRPFEESSAEEDCRGSKKGSSKWTKTDGPRNLEFHWQAGYAAFSVSQSNLDEVKRYIENQEEHHRKLTFQEELRAFYRRHEIEFDERYVWD